MKIPDNFYWHSKILENQNLMVADRGFTSLEKIKIIAYRQEPSDKILTHSKSQQIVL